MTPDDLPIHTFEERRARRYRPNPELAKTAILVELADPTASVEILASFGEFQTLSGSFYVVAEGDGSYGSSREEFERAHTKVGPNQYVRAADVLAYRATEPCRVETVLSDATRETMVVARPGDWIVRQPRGEVLVIAEDAEVGFAQRYDVAHPLPV
jgi:hypothetical protein